MKPILRTLAVALLCLASVAGFGQKGSTGLAVQFQQAGSPIGTFKTWLPINCSTGLTCTFSGGIVTMVGTGVTAGSAINPGFVGSLSGTAYAYTQAVASPLQDAVNRLSAAGNVSGGVVGGIIYDNNPEVWNTNPLANFSGRLFLGQDLQGSAVDDISNVNAWVTNVPLVMRNRLDIIGYGTVGAALGFGGGTAIVRGTKFYSPLGSPAQPTLSTVVSPCGALTSTLNGTYWVRTAWLRELNTNGGPHTPGISAVSPANSQAVSSGNCLTVSNPTVPSPQYGPAPADWRVYVCGPSASDCTRDALSALPSTASASPNMICPAARTWSNVDDDACGLNAGVGVATVAGVSTFPLAKTTTPPYCPNGGAATACVDLSNPMIVIGAGANNGGAFQFGIFLRDLTVLDSGYVNAGFPSIYQNVALNAQASMSNSVITVQFAAVGNQFAVGSEFFLTGMTPAAYNNGTYTVCTTGAPWPAGCAAPTGTTITAVSTSNTGLATSTVFGSATTVSTPAVAIWNILGQELSGLEGVNVGGPFGSGTNSAGALIYGATGNSHIREFQSGQGPSGCLNSNAFYGLIQDGRPFGVGSGGSFREVDSASFTVNEAGGCPITAEILQTGALSFSTYSAIHVEGTSGTTPGIKFEDGASGLVNGVSGGVLGANNAAVIAAVDAGAVSGFGVAQSAGGAVNIFRDDNVTAGNGNCNTSGTLLSNCVPGVAGSTQGGFFTNDLFKSATSATITGTVLAAGACDTGTVTVNGAKLGQPVLVTSTTATQQSGSFDVSAQVTAANTVTIQVCAVAAGTPASLAYNVKVFRQPI